MRAWLRERQAVIVALMLGVGGCASTRRQSDAPASVEHGAVTSVDPFGVHVPAERGAPSFDFSREDLDTNTTLRAVLALSTATYTAGDDGRIYRRTLEAPWVVEAHLAETGVALLAAGPGLVGAEPVVAIGGQGRVFARSLAGQWSERRPRLNVTLRAVSWEQALTVAGEHGALFEEHAGQWVRVPTGVESALRTIVAQPSGYFVAGDDGVILDCRRSNPDQVSSCARVSASAGVQWWSATGFPPVLVGTDGHALNLGSSPTRTRARRPDGSFVGLTAVFDPVTQAMTTSDDPRQPQLFVLTAGGELAMLSRELDRLVPIGSMGAPLLAMSGSLPHLFAVGENGHVVHGVLRHFELPRVTTRDVGRR